jgi:flagellar hook-length control protein FliK
VALLAAQIAGKVDGKSTRFDVQLDPHGLGKVDVRVEISARGEVSAALTFENPQAASELRGKAGELQTALEQAGFDLSKTSLSFNSGGQGQHHGLFDQQQQNQAPVWRGRAFADLSDTPETAPAPVMRRAAAGGVDVRI